MSSPRDIQWRGWKKSQQGLDLDGVVLREGSNPELCPLHFFFFFFFLTSLSLELKAVQKGIFNKT